MHNKFCVSENKVITGSANPTYRGFHVNPNNIVVVHSKAIAENYRREWEELKSPKERPTENPLVNLSGIYIENYFCPEDNCEEEVLEEMRKADDTIHFMLFSFTADKIGDYLIKTDVRVKGIMESFGLNKYSEYEKLIEAGIEVKLDRNDRNVHHKVFIIDNRTVITGSYNPTKSGTTRNDENILIIHSKKVAGAYQREFQSLLKTNSFSSSR